MTIEYMSQIKQRRACGRACVENFEQRLKKAVQIHHGGDDAPKHNVFVTGVPPAVCAPPAKTTGAARFNEKFLPVYQGGKRP